jgi:hypothetical protein
MIWLHRYVAKQETETEGDHPEVAIVSVYTWVDSLPIRVISQHGT